jgi:Pvc16 N-terminal domain
VSSKGRVWGEGVFDDLNRTIEALLKAELPAEVASQVSIGFATPDESFPPQGLSLPAINLFLFEIRENASLREMEPLRDRRADGTTVLVPPPVRIDCHYLVTAVATTQLGSEMDEHHILGAALKVLLRHRSLPEAVLQGSLAGKSPPVRAAAARQDAHPSGIELWQALKGKPRASLHYTLTVPVDVGAPEEMAKPAIQLNVGSAGGPGGL